jgi:hypothetical protein
MGGVVPKAIQAPVKFAFGGDRSPEVIDAVKKSATPAPTTAEVEQAGATDMDNKGIKRRRRGRSMTILTGSAGVQEGATLGTPTLLG